MHIPDWLINIAKDSESVQVKSSNLYKTETMNIINPRVEEQDLSKKVQPITVVIQGSKTDGNQSGKAILLAYWSKSLEKIAEREVESADALTMYDTFTDQIKNIDNKIKDNKYEEAATDSEKLLDEFNPEVAEKDPLAPELEVDQLDPNKLTEEEFLTSIDVGDIVQVSGSAKFQFKDSYLDSQYFKVTEDEFRTKLASSKPSLSYNTFNKAHMGAHNYVVSFYKDATLDNEVPVGDVVLIERDGSNQNWVILGDGNDTQNAFYKACRRLTIYPEDIGYAINPKGELVKSSGVSMVFFDSPEEAAEWQELTQEEKDSKTKGKDKKDKAPAKETSPESTKPSSTEKLDEAMDALTEESVPAGEAPAPAAKDEKPFKSFKDYQEEKKEDAVPAEGEEQTYSASDKCPKCGKPMKEDTDGNPKYCQGHPMIEDTHTGEDPYSIPKSIEQTENSVVHSQLKLSKLDKEAISSEAKAAAIMELVDSTDLDGLATIANMILGTSHSFEDFETDSGVAVAGEISEAIEHMSTNDLDNVYRELKSHRLVASLNVEAGSLNKKLRELKKQMEDEKDPSKLDSMLSAIKKLKEHISDTKKEKEDRKKEKEEKKEKAAEIAKETELPKAATILTNYGDVKVVCKVHLDAATSRYCVEWTNGDWRTDLDKPAVAEYLRNDHLTDEELAMVFEKVEKSETVEISRKESKDGESKLDVKKVKDLEEVKEALLAKGFTKEAATLDKLIKDSFHMNTCSQPGHDQVDSYLCQKCLKDKCSSCSKPGTESMGTVCADCIGK